MSSSNSFSTRLNRRAQELGNDYISYLDDLNKGSNWIFDRVNNSWWSDTPYVITDSKDADGLAAQVVFKKGLEQILEFFGNHAKIDSHRIGRFTKELEEGGELEHLPTVLELEPEKDFIISDLGSLESEMANGYVSDLLFVDHHGVRSGFDEHFVTINPNKHQIDGGRELSSAMQATMLLNMVYDRIEAENSSNGDERIKSNLNKLRDRLDLISLIGLAGASADMQKEEGLNSVLFEYLEDRRIIEKYNSPFYGINSKSANKVMAQSDPVFNFKYFVPDREELEGVFNKEFHSLNRSDKSKLSELYDKFRWVFTTENLKKGSSSSPKVNMVYLNSLSNDEVSELNSLVSSLTGNNLVEHTSGGLALTTRFGESKFEGFTDNLVSNEKKIPIATDILKNAKVKGKKRSFDPDGSIGKQSELSDYLVSKFEDSVIAFGDVTERDYNLAKLRREQYVSTYALDIIGTSVAELANSMTALSKLGYGDVFLDAIEELIDLGENSPKSLGKTNIDRVLEEHHKYRLSVYNGMTAFTEKLSDSKVIQRIGNQSSRLVYCDMSFLEGEIAAEMPLEKVNGVFLGIAANTQILPGGKVIAFGGVPVEINGKEYVKISGRATDCSEYIDINIRSLMEKYGGGGHKQAAACVIPQNKLDDFLSDVEYHNFYEG